MVRNTPSKRQMNKKEIQAEVERILTTDGIEPKYLKRNLRNLVMSRCHPKMLTRS